MNRLFGRLRLFQILLRDGRLTWRLVRDPRTPLRAKLILGASVLFVVSPINWIPNFVPVLGQLEDVALLSLAMELFLRNVPEYLKAEHRATLGRRQGRVIDL
jgi:uncharacterized membrane protein YkvA (DUF1232 family)